MVEDVATLYPDIAEAVTPPGGGEHGYYRRGDTGWIITAPVWPSYRADMEYKGYTFLARYGTFVCDLGPKNRDRTGRPWDVILEPWRALFQEGGAKEFPVSQIIAYKWHIKPPYREVEFPQLQGMEIADLQCPECTRIFSSPNPLEAAQQLRTHLTSKVNGQHDYRVEDLQALGREWDIDFGLRRMGRRPVIAKTEKAVSLEHSVPEPYLSEPVVDIAFNLQYKCPDCEWAPLKTSKKPDAGLRMHRRHHHGVK